MSSGRVWVLGAGRVGRALARGLRRAGHRVTLQPARGGLPSRAIRAELVVVAVRDDEIERRAAELASIGVSGARAAGGRSGRVAVVHCAGSRGPDALAALRSETVSVAQMHPLVSFADDRAKLEGAYVHLAGDEHAVRVARRAVKALGMMPFHVQDLDLSLYHAAAALAANGAVALLDRAVQVLEVAGVEEGAADAMLGRLLASVADNVERLGATSALTGPIRRGDARAVEIHLGGLRRLAPQAVPLYVAMANAQLATVTRLSEGDRGGHERIAALLAALGPRAIEGSAALGPRAIEGSGAEVPDKRAR